jgi:hypothetical protein
MHNRTLLQNSRERIAKPGIGREVMTATGNIS